MTPTYHNLTGVPDKAGRANRYTTTGLKTDGYQKNVYELHDGHQLNAEDGENNLMFIKFVGRSPEEKRELEQMAKEEVSLSEDAALESVVRYKDYIEEQDMLVVEETNWKGIEPGTYMSDEELLYLAKDLLSALTYLHARGQVHGYVHPSNIIPFERPGSADPAKLWGFKLIGHGLVPKVIWTWKDLPGRRFTPPEFRNKKREYRPTKESDVWMLGQTLTELHSYGRSAGPQYGNLVWGSHDWPATFTELRMDAAGRCEKHRHSQLSELLKEMLEPNPRSRMKAEVALDDVVSWYLQLSLTEELPALEEAKKRARKETRGRHVMGRLWLDLKSLLFFVMFWVCFLSSIIIKLV